MLKLEKYAVGVNIFVISAFYNMEITLYKITSFVDAVFMKPVNIKELINTIQSYEIKNKDEESIKFKS